MTTDSSNYQWPQGYDFQEEDRGTMALGVKDEVLPIPDQIVATENFETDPITGSGTWTLTTSSPHTGSRCLRSAVIGNNGITDYTFTIPGGATSLRFWHRVSSEQNFDFFRVYKDSAIPANLLFQLSGTLNLWQQLTVDLTGATSVIFRYIKDSSALSGLDAAFIDDLEWIVPGIPGIQNYEPFHLNENNCVKVVLCDNNVEVTGIVDTRQLDCEIDSITVCPPASGVFDVNVINQVENRFLDCETDSVTICTPASGLDVVQRPLDCAIDSVAICPGEQPIVVVPGTCFPVNVRLDCEVDSVTICPPASGTFEVYPIDYPSAPSLTDDGGPVSITGASSIADNTFRAFTVTVISGPVTINGITVPTGYSLSRSADPGGTVPGFSLNGTGGQILVDTLREL